MIGDLVARLIAAGTPAEIAAVIVTEAFAAGAAVASTGIRRQPMDEAAERRREWDRNRKRDQRSLRLPESEWLPLVSDILKRDGNKCTYCGSGENLTADHVVPVTRGGTNDASNLTACCIPCNSKKSNKLVSEWLPAASTIFHPSVHLNPQTNNSASIPKDSKKESKRQTRGVRIPSDWSLSDAERVFAKQEGFSEFEIGREINKFRDYWTACAGAKGVKLDWAATWRQWIRSGAERAGKTPAPNGNAGAIAGSYYAKPESEQLAAWDAYSERTYGKRLPRDKNQGWRVKAEWPPGHGALPLDHPADAYQEAVSNALCA